MRHGRRAAARAPSRSTASRPGTSTTGTDRRGATSSRTRPGARRLASRRASSPPSRQARDVVGWPSSSAASASTASSVDRSSTSGHSAQAPQRRRRRPRRPTSPARGRAGCGCRATTRRPARRPAELGRRRPGTRGRPGATRRCGTLAGALAGDRRPQARRGRTANVDVVVAASAPGRTRRTPGPRLALVAGTRTRDGRARNTMATTAQPEAEPAAAAAASTGTVTRRGRAGDGPVRVLQAVAGDGADDALARARAARLRRPAAARRPTRPTPARRRRPPAGQQPVGREDLAVGDRVDAAAGLVAGGDAPWSRTPGCRSGSRWRWSPGARTTCAGHDRRGAGGLEAPHPRALRSAMPSAAYSR